MALFLATSADIYENRAFATSQAFGAGGFGPPLITLLKCLSNSCVFNSRRNSLYAFLMKRSGLSDRVFGNVVFRWGVSARILRSISPICEMGLIVLMAIGLLSCAFMIYCLARWVKEGTEKAPTTRK